MTLLPPGVIVLADAPAVAGRGAEEFVRSAQQSVAERGTFIVALSGGTTPKAMYELLATDEEIRAAMPWWQTHFFWGDERHVPPDSPDSNYRMANDTMLSQSPTPSGNIHRVPAELANPAQAARQYDQEMRQTFQQLGREVDPAPSFDLLLLGLGPDAHIASLFPGSAALVEHASNFTANFVEKLDTTRLTITPRVIAAAQRVLLLVCGADKAEAVHRTFSATYESSTMPAQLVTHRTAPTLWLLDEAAASLLKQR